VTLSAPGETIDTDRFPLYSQALICGPNLRLLDTTPLAPHPREADYDASELIQSYEANHMIGRVSSWFTRVFIIISRWVDGFGPTCILMWVSLAIASLIASAETDRMLGRSLSEGKNWSIRKIVGPGALGAKDAWADWAKASNEPAQLRSVIGGLVTWHTLFECVFFVSCAVVLWRLIVRSTKHGGRAPDTFETGGPAKFALFIFVFAETIEGVLLLWAAHILQRPSVSGWEPWAVAVTATVKWIALVALALALVRDKRFRAAAARTAVRLTPVLWVQRLSLVVVVIVVILTLLPLPGALDQIPDAQRRWVDSGGLGAIHGLVAAFSYGLLAIGLYFLGRRRTERAWEKWVECTSPTEPAAVFWWLMAPGVVAGLGLVLLLSNHSQLIDRQNTAFFVVLPTTIAACSLAVRSIANRTGTAENHSRKSRMPLHPMLLVGAVVMLICAGYLSWDDRASWWIVGIPIGALIVVIAIAAVRRNFGVLDLSADSGSAHEGRVRMTLATGDVLALSVLLAGAFGLVRAFTAPVVLAAVTDLIPGNPWSVVLLALGWGLVMAVPAIAVRCRYGTSVAYFARWTKHASEQSQAPQHSADTPPRERTVFDWAAAIICVGILLWLFLCPTALTRWLGVVATALLSVGSWAVLIGLVIVHLQRKKPLEVFMLFGMKATPVLTLVAVVVFVVSLSGGDRDLHTIRTLSDQRDPPVRITLDARFTNWMADSGACRRPIDGAPGGLEVQPMILVAASGGGIRAAIWTADAMAEIADMGGCGPNAVLASSGVSGGSVGLAIARLSPDSSTVADAVRRLAGPEALSVGISGSIVGDLVAGTTGSRVQWEGSKLTWHDRAGLMEQAWENSVPELQTPYSSEIQGPTGALILNSTAAGSNCRVLVSQIELGPKEAGAGPNCRDQDGFPASSIDFQNSLSSCFPNMAWSTAAMLSARFPVVTPSGRMPPYEGHGVGKCEAGPMQLIDGGYAEGSGLGTLAEIAPDVANLVRQNNIRVLTSGDGSSGTLVVPIVVYLDDEPGADLAPEEGKASPELLIPMIGRGAHSRLASNAAWIQRISNSFADICPTAGPDKSDSARAGTTEDSEDRCQRAIDTVRSAVGASVITASPPMSPSVEVPLGWTLSTASINHLEKAVGVRDPTCVGKGNISGQGDVSGGMQALAQLLCTSPN